MFLNMAAGLHIRMHAILESWEVWQEIPGHEVL
jgi:hypothetical protein